MTFPAVITALSYKIEIRRMAANATHRIFSHLSVTLNLSFCDVFSVNIYLLCYAGFSVNIYPLCYVGFSIIKAPCSPFPAYP